jgi:YVTN family beta-propeller protein
MIRTPLFNRFARAALVLAAMALLLALPPATPSTRAQAEPALLFIENVGQFPDAATRFQAHLPHMTLSLTEEALWLTLLAPPPADPQIDTPATPDQGLNLKLTFAGANPAPILEPFDPLNPTISYFTGSDAAQWHSAVPVWGGVRYIDLYPGIDLEITRQHGQLALRLVVAAEALAAATPLADLRLHLDGADALALTGAGGLRLTTALGEVNLPLLQVVTAAGAPIDLPAFTPTVDGPDVTAPFAAAPPVELGRAGIAATGDLAYSTLIGGGNYFDSSQDIAIDDAGYAYLTGRAYTGFPTTPGVFDPSITDFFNDAFIAKFTPDGSALVYATLLGGNNYAETGYAIALDGGGNAYITGYTVSADFPTTPGAFDTTPNGGGDVFVAKINPTGTALLYATLLGGNTDEYGYGLALDAGGQAVITGDTRSTDFPTTGGALAPTYRGGFSDGFVVKLSADASALEYATFLGGSADESSHGLALDSAGNAYVTGYTGSADFPTTPGAYDPTSASADVFVAKLNPTGSALVYGTFLGGSQAEGGRAIALDSTGSAFIAGRTDSPDFPATPGAFDPSFNNGGNDGFVARLSPTGNGLLYATYLGGSNEEEARDLAVDAVGSVYVTGYTYAADFPTTVDAFAATCPGCAPRLDAFVAKLNPTGTGLVYGSYLGGSEDDHSYGLAQDGNGYVYLTGDTRSPDFPTTPGAFDTTLGSYGKGFVAKLWVGTGVGVPPPVLPDHSCAADVLDTVTVETEPRGLAIDPVRQRLYVANYGNNSVSVVDTRNDAVLQTIRDVHLPNGVTYDAAQNIIWVTNFALGWVTPIQANDDATGFTVLPPVTVGAGPWGVGYDSVHNYIYVANSQDDSVSVIDAAARTVVATLTGAFNLPHYLAANPITGKIYVANTGQNSVVVIDGTSISNVVQLWDSGRADGIAVDEVRNVIYVATIQTNRIVTIGPINGQPDQFLGWASFQRGYNANRRVPLRAIAVNPLLGPSGDGGHLWATTSTGDGSEQNQALFIPKGWSSRFHAPYTQPVGDHPGQGIAIDRSTNRVYISSGTALGLVTVLGDSNNVCGDVSIAGTPAETDQITIEVHSAETALRSDINHDGRVDVLDLVLVAARYGSSDAAADLNGDGVVDILDVTMMAGYFGQALTGQ